MKVNLQLIAITFVVLLAVANGKEIQTGPKSEGVQRNYATEFVTPQASVTVVTPGTSVLLDCRLTDPSAKIALFFRPVLNETYKDISRHINVVAVGQIFLLNEVDLSDDGYYTCEREDKDGKANVLPKLFVLEEEDNYNSCLLKHVLQDTTIVDLTICEQFLVDGVVDNEDLCGTCEGVVENAASVGVLDSARQDMDETVAWLRDRVAVYVETAVSTWNTSIYRDDILTVYGLWNTILQAVSRYKGHVIFKVYKNGLWNTMVETASWCREQLVKLPKLTIEFIFYVREFMAETTWLMDSAMYAILSVKDAIEHFLVQQVEMTIDVIVGLDWYLSQEPCDTLKALGVDGLMVLKRALTWLYDTTQYLMSVYMKILSYIMVSIEKCIELFIDSEQSKIELRNDVDGLVMWFSDVILAVRLAITWLVNNVAMVIMTISDVIYQRNDQFSIITPYGRFDKEMFWQAARMDLLETVCSIIESLTTRFVYSKISRVVVRGAMVYKDAIFCGSRTYNVMVVLVYVCIFIGCRLRFKIAALLQPWTKRFKMYILSQWRQLSKSPDKKHRAFLRTCVRRTKMLRNKPKIIVVKKSDHVLYMTESGSISLV